MESRLFHSHIEPASRCQPTSNTYPIPGSVIHQPPQWCSHNHLRQETWSLPEHTNLILPLFKLCRHASKNVRIWEAKPMRMFRLAVEPNSRARSFMMKQDWNITDDGGFFKQNGSRLIRSWAPSFRYAAQKARRSFRTRLQLSAHCSSASRKHS